MPPAAGPSIEEDEGAAKGPWGPADAVLGAAPEEPKGRFRPESGVPEKSEESPCPSLFESKNEGKRDEPDGCAEAAKTESLSLSIAAFCANSTLF